MVLLTRRVSVWQCAALLILAATLAFFVAGCTKEGAAPPTEAPSASPAAPAARESTAPAPTPTAPATPIASPTATPIVQAALPDRTDCAAIRASDYRSETERQWFLANCVPTPSPVARASSAAPAFALPVVSVETCATEVTLAFNTTRAYYTVTGRTIEELNASVVANAPRLGSEVAAGLMESLSRLAGRFCVRPDSCGVGPLVVSSLATITLPRLAEASVPVAPILTIWNDFVARVTLHEERHVIILQEGLEEARRRIAGVPSMPDCDQLEHAVDVVWQQALHEIDRRQDAFHLADSQGFGGLVVR